MRKSNIREKKRATLNTVRKKSDFYHLCSEPVYGCIKYQENKDIQRQQVFTSPQHTAVVSAPVEIESEILR